MITVKGHFLSPLSPKKRLSFVNSPEVHTETNIKLMTHLKPKCEKCFNVYKNRSITLFYLFTYFRLWRAFEIIALYKYIVLFIIRTAHILKLTAVKNYDFI